MAKQLGRPSAYKPEYDQIAFSMALLGATDAEIADAFDVTEQTINNWKSAHPSFFESLKGGKIQADAKVANRLYARALGYEHDDIDVRTVALGNNQGSEIVLTPIRKYYPPDTAAGIFWLKNRQPKKWRDKPETEQGDSVAEALLKLAQSLPN